MRLTYLSPQKTSELVDITLPVHRKRPEEKQYVRTYQCSLIEDYLTNRPACPVVSVAAGQEPIELEMRRSCTGGLPLPREATTAPINNQELEGASISMTLYVLPCQW